MIVVIFKNELREGAAGPAYNALAERMWEIVSAMPGFIGFDSFTTPEGNEVAIIKFESEEALAAWRNHPEHQEAQRRGRAAPTTVCRPAQDRSSRTWGDIQKPSFGALDFAGGMV